MDAKPTVFDVELPSFSTDVVERSKEVPVVLLFWTDEIPPAADTKRHLETLASQYQGKFALAFVMSPRRRNWLSNYGSRASRASA